MDRDRISGFAITMKRVEDKKTVQPTIVFFYTS